MLQDYQASSINSSLLLFAGRPVILQVMTKKLIALKTGNKHSIKRTNSKLAVAFLFLSDQQYIH